jgi:hypothetical protein
VKELPPMPAVLPEQFVNTFPIDWRMLAESELPVSNGLRTPTKTLFSARILLRGSTGARDEAGGDHAPNNSSAHVGAQRGRLNFVHGSKERE